jgi:5-methylcytosine-specific restriction endonuclease McrA
MRLCSGCQTKVEDHVRFCVECTAERNPCVVSDGIQQHTVTDRERYAFLYSGVRWRVRVQPKALAANPFCSMCGAIAEIVDHIVPAGVAIAQAQASGRWPCDKYAGFYFTTNLHGLCRKCHSIKTEQDKQHVGEWPSVVDKELSKPKKVWSF